jgi:hypothetical protein
MIKYNAEIKDYLVYSLKDIETINYIPILRIHAECFLQIVTLVMK